ncbi:MAG: hypothetical protein ACLFVG_04700 [Candidatus Aminicenantes bacterium]
MINLKQGNLESAKVRLGKVYEQKGNKRKARANYRKFLELWNDADSGITEVEDAKKRLAEL